MRIRIPVFNAILLHVGLPLLLIIGVGLVAHAIMAIVLALSRSLRNLLLLLATVLISWFVVRVSPVYGDLTPPLVANALNTTFGFLLVLTGNLYRFDFRVAPSRWVDLAIVIYLATAALLVWGLGFNTAILQLGAFSILLYMLIADTWPRKFLGLSAPIIGGARILIVGAVAWLAFMQWRRAAVGFAAFFFVAFAYLLFQPETFHFIEETLMDLRQDGILLKGRVNFWLAMVQSDLSMLGQGPGSALLAIEARIGVSHLPHSDVLRVLSEYGFVGLLLIVGVLAFNMASGKPQQRGAAVFLLAFMLTGNPLSFPTVVISYLLMSHARVVPTPASQGTFRWSGRRSREA